MENTLELTRLSDIDPNLFTNTRPLWHPPGARGVYGGAVIAQCLAAAQRTVDHAFTVHSMHCYFVLAGNSEIPIIYHVERVRDGKSFATRTVQARQRAKPIFTVTLSFMRERNKEERIVQHAVSMPDVGKPEDGYRDQSRGPFETIYLPHASNGDENDPSGKRTRMWLKARGQISVDGGHQAHLSALAYMTDSFFIGTVARVHKLWRTVPKPSKKQLEDEDESEKKEREEMVKDMQMKIKAINDGQDENVDNLPEIGMMVSLDHTIFFHRPREFRADEWLLSEMNTPWAGDDRGLVEQRLWTRDGKLVASCYQEGLVRLKQQKSATKL